MKKIMQTNRHIIQRLFRVLTISILLISSTFILSACSTSTSNSSLLASTPEMPKGVWLTDLEYREKDYYLRIDEGNIRSHGTDGCGYNHYLSGEGEVIYPLHKMYASLSARWVLDADWPNAKADAGTLLIYADDELVFSSSPISILGEMYQDVYIDDITECDLLRIKFEPYHHDGTYSNIGRLNGIWLEPNCGEKTVGQTISYKLTPITFADSMKIELLPSERYLSYHEYGVEDSYGNEYSGGHFDFCSYHRKGYDAHQSYVILRTNGNWKNMRGKFFTRNTQDSKFRIVFQIYADDTLVYSSTEMGRNDYPVDFDISISHADKVTLISYSDDYTMLGTNPGIILVNAEVYN